MMKIYGFRSIPEFIQKYIDRNEPGLDTITHDFCEMLMELYYDNKIDNDGKLVFIFETDNYSVRRFVEFYFEKSKLDSKHYCKYEDELGLPKSLTNEFFTLILDNEDVRVMYIESYENNKLIMKLMN